MTGPDDDRQTDVVVVTGARGIGLASALKSPIGSVIVIGEHSEALLDDALTKLNDAGRTAIGHRCDVAQPEDVVALVDRAAAEGQIVRVVHAAGLSPSMASAEQIIDVNLAGTRNMIEAASGRIIDGGTFICFSSLAADRAAVQPHRLMLARACRTGDMSEIRHAARDVPAAGYALSKLGVRILVEQAAIELAAHGVRVLSISPGAVRTPMGELEVASRPMAPTQDGQLAFVPMKRWAEPEEIAAAIDLLCAPQIAYLTGADIRIDGGAIAYMREAAPPAMLAKFDDPWS